MKTTALVLILAFSFMAFGCNKENKENKEPKTVTYYKEHPEERKVLMKKCSDNPGKYEENPDCINAETAQHQDMWGDPADFRLK
jgi:hypothetical protein